MFNMDMIPRYNRLTDWAFVGGEEMAVLYLDVLGINVQHRKLQRKITHACAHDYTKTRMDHKFALLQ